MNGTILAPSPTAHPPSRTSRFVAWWLALGLVLTTATQLRLTSLPIGPGEALVAAWIGLAALQLVVRGVVKPGPSTLVLLFWIIGFALLCLGWIAGLQLGVSSLSNGRDAVAFALVASLVGVIVLRPDRRSLLTQVVRYVTILAVVGLGGLLLSAAIGATSRIGLLEVSYGGIRFRGWAVNPNQVALLLLPLPLVAVSAALSGGRTRLVWWVLAAAALAIGGFTRSDALMASWIAVAAFLLIAGALGWSMDPVQVSYRALVWRVLVPVVLAITVVGLGRAALSSLERQAGEVFGEGGQGADRFARWGYGLTAMTLSPVVGLGPGAFSGATGPFGGQEAHNTPIDWAASTGGLGLALFAVVVGCLTVGLVRRRQWIGVSVLAGLLAFSGLHYVFRQPVFWVFLLAPIEGAIVVPRRYAP